MFWKRTIPFGAGRQGFQLKSAKELPENPVQLKSGKEVKKETKLSAVLGKDRAATTHRMPKIANKVFSAHDRVGKALCAAHQTGDCAAGDE